MNQQQIREEIEKALHLNSETDLVEFKNASGGFPKKEVRKTLSAFGNTGGGIVVFGVEEKEDKSLGIVGVKDVAKNERNGSYQSAWRVY